MDFAQQPNSASILNASQNASVVEEERSAHSEAPTPRHYGILQPHHPWSKAQLCPEWMYSILPALYGDTADSATNRILSLLYPLQLAVGEQKVYFSADTRSHHWGIITTVSRGVTGAPRYTGKYYIPMLCREFIGYDIAAYVEGRRASDDDIYNNLGIPHDRRGGGLDAVPTPPYGGEPRCAMSTLIHLAIIGSPRKCLLGYEIAAILMGRFRFYMTTENDWQFLLFRALAIHGWFLSLPAPGHLCPAERVWYVDYSQVRPKPLKYGKYLWRSAPGGRKRNKKQNREA